MIPSWSDPKVYELYTGFINTSVLKNDSFLTNDKNVLTIDALDDIVQRFIKGGIEGKEDFDKKVAKQFNGAAHNTLMTFAHANWLWCMSPSNFRFESKLNSPLKILKLEGNDGVTINKDVIPEGGFGHAGPFLSYNKPNEIAFIILLLKQLKMQVSNGSISSLEQVNDAVEKICLKCRYDVNGVTPLLDKTLWEMLPEGRLAMYNILLHLSKPEKYEAIASASHKDQICSTFNRLLDDAPDAVKRANHDDQITYIRDKIATSWNVDKNAFTFYDDKLQDIWNFNSDERNFNEFQALQYKKAIILYGPPGTSKTHSAMSLAHTLIYQHYFSKPENVKDYFKANPDISSSRIHRL